MFNQPTSLFGNQNQSTGSNSLFGQQQPSLQGQGLFGQASGFQPQNQQPQSLSLFGQNQQQTQQPQQNTLFGGGQVSSGFGALGSQPSFTQNPINNGGSGGLFGGQQQQPFGGNAPVNQNQFGGGTFSTFSQAVGTNQQQSGFNSFGQPTGSSFGGGLLGSNMGGGLALGTNPLGGGGLFGQNQNTGGGGLFGNQNKSINPQDQSQNQGPTFYQNPQQQSVHTMNQYFEKKEVSQQEPKGTSLTQCFHSIRVDPQFANSSGQMLKLQDLIGMKTQQPQTSYEFLAQNEFKQNPQMYPQYQKLMVLAQGNQNQNQNQLGGFNTSAGSGGLFGQKNQNQNSLLGGQSTFSTFQQPQQNQGGLFGNKSTGMNQGFNGNLGMNTQTSLFSNNQQQQQQQPFGGNNAGGLFGNQQKPTGGLFNQQTPNQFGTNQNQLGNFQSPQQNTQTNTLFGQNVNQGLNLGLNQGTQSQGLFGAKPLGGGGLFQQPQQNQPLGGGGPGLFGGNQQQQQPQQNTGTSLFGNQQQTQQPVGLFGGQPQQQQQQQQQQPGGLFQSTLGGNQLGTNTGLFGNNQQTQQTQPNAGGGLFSQTPLTQNPGTGLFKQQQPTSLFSQPSQQQPSTLFGATQQPSTGGGIFQNAQQQPTGGLFQQQPTQQQQTQSSIFGNTQPTQTGLFSQNTLFSGTAQTNPQNNLTLGQNANPTQNGIDINTLYQFQRDIYGVENSFLSKESPFAKVDEDLKKIMEQSEKLTKDPAYNVYLQSKSSQHIEKLLRDMPTETGPTDITPQLYSSKLFLTQRTPTFDEELFSEQELIKKQMKERFRRENEQSYIQPQKESFNAYGETGSNKTYFINTKTRFEPVLSKSIHPSQSSKIIKEDQKERPVKNNSDQIVLQVILTEDNKEIEKSFSIHKTRTVKDLSDSVKMWLIDKKVYDPSRQNFKIMYKNQLLKTKNTLKDAQLQENAKLYVLLDDRETQETTQGKQNAQREEKSTKPAKKVYSEEELQRLRPKPPKKGYWTNPDFSEDIREMSIEELEKVYDFSIENEFGKIEFFGTTDLTGVNLAEIIDIGEMYAEAYDDENAKTQKPAVGQKLNKPALITLKNVYLTSGESLIEKEMQLKQALADTDAQYIVYEPRKGEWKFKVPHFTRYGIQKNQDQTNQQEMEDQSQYDQNDQQEQDQQPGMTQSRMNTFNQDQLYNTQVKQDTTNNYKPNTGGFQTFQQPSQPILFQSDLGIKAGTVPHKQLGSLTSVKSVEGSFKQPLNRLASQQQDVQMSDKMSQSSKRQLQDIDLSIRSQEVIFDSDKNLRYQKVSIAQKKLDLDRIINSKQAKLEEIGKMDEAYTSLSNQDVSDFLKDLGIRTVKKTNLNTNGGRRVCFRSDGSFVSINNQNKIILVKNKTETNEIINKDVLQKHFTIEPREKEVERDIISRQMMSMNLHQRNKENKQQKVDENMQIDQQNKQNFTSQFEDPYFANLFSTIKMPFTNFNANPNTIYKFLHDLAKNYINHLSRTRDEKQIQTLQNEFYMVSLLNALFGNPHIHLIQLHKAFKGLVNIEQKIQHFKQNEFIDGDTFQIAKIRKNAVAEVIRFICKNEFAVTERNQNQDQIYETALSYLLNGDISGAVKFLNNNNKVKMALIISQAVNNQVSIELLKQQLNLQLYSKMNAKTLNIIHFLIGQYSFNQQQQSDRSWLQALCYYFLIKSPPNAGLKETLYQFHQETYQKSFDYQQLKRKFHQNEVQETPLFYLFMKIYANIDQQASLLQLNQFYNVDTQITQNRLREKKQQLPSYRVQWLTQLIFRQLSEYYFREKSKYDDYYPQILVDDLNFTRITTSLVHELLLAKDWLGSVFISQFIPQSYQHIQKQITFHILQKNVLGLLNIADLDYNRKTILTDYKIPQTMLFCARGILFEYQQYYERAIKDWQDAKNFEKTHTIFLEKIIPNYFHLEFNQARVLKFLKENKELLQQMTFELKKVHQHLIEWLHRANFIEIFMNFVEKLQFDENQSDVIRIKTYSEAKQIKNEVVNNFISEQISNWEFKKSAQSFNQEIFKHQQEQSAFLSQ